MRVSQEFSIEHLYNINNNSYSVLIAGNGLNLDRATYTLPKTNWNSGIDYSTDNIDCEKVIYSYNKTITQDGTTDTAAEEIKVHNAVTTWATGGNLKHITAAAVGGAITGGLAAATCGMSLGAQITGSAMAGTAGYCAEKLVAREQGTATGMTSAAIGGAAGAMTGVVISGLTPKIASGFPKTASSEGKVNNAMSFAKGTTIKNVNGVDVIQDNNLINAGMIDARGRSNIERMSKGLAPIGSDGKSINLHHVDQSMTGPVKEMTPTYHQQNYNSLHSNAGQTPSQIDRKQFDNWRKDYWKIRSNDFN